MEKFIVNDYLDNYEYMTNPMDTSDEKLKDMIIEIIKLDFENITKEQINWNSYDTIMGLIFGGPVMTNVRFYNKTDELEEYLAEWLRRQIKGEVTN